MATNHESVAALPAAANANHTLIRDLLVRRLAYVVSAASEVLDLVAVDPASGAAIIVIICLGRNYLYDSTDTTTAHDGVSTLVSLEGRRYKLSTGVDVLAYSVLDRDLATPPGSPTIGNRYLIAAGATGAWSGHSNEVAIFTSRGWEFVNLGTGRLILIEDEDAYAHKNAGGSWVVGFGAQSLSAGSILPSMMLGGAARVRFLVENQTTNTPPAVVNGNAYIIGSSPTGAWSGHAAKIAHGEGGVWVIYAPAAGWRAYDKAIGKDYVYNGSAWVTAAGNWTSVLRRYTANDTWSKPARLIGIKVWLCGGGAGSAGNGGTTSFGAHLSATGGVFNGGQAGGTGSGGDWNMPGETYNAVTQSHSGLGLDFTRGRGEPGNGGGGGASVKYIAAAALGSSEAVTIGAAGTTPTFGTAGVVLVEEFIEA